jgi:hypothetical protein
MTFKCIDRLRAQIRVICEEKSLFSIILKKLGGNGKSPVLGIRGITGGVVTYSHTKRRDAERLVLQTRHWSLAV